MSAAVTASMSPARRGRGFSLIELVVTLAIMGVLVSAAAPVAQLAVQRSKEAELRAALREIRSGIDAYKRAVDEGRILRRADESGYPPSLEVLVEGVQDAKVPRASKIYFLRRIPRDPFDDQPRAAGSASWGLRSYASPPDAPVPGADVYDVFSRATGTGLNGRPYREW